MCPVLQEACNSMFGNPPSSSRNSLTETPGEKPEGSRAAQVVATALEPSGFAPGISLRELRELEGGFPNVELHASCKMRQIWVKNPDNTDLYLFPQCPTVLEFRNSDTFPDILAPWQLKGFSDTFETFGKRHCRMLTINNQSDPQMPVLNYDHSM
jgi:hypothetical protein